MAGLIARAENSILMKKMDIQNEHDLIKVIEKAMRARGYTTNSFVKAHPELQMTRKHLDNVFALKSSPTWSVIWRLKKVLNLNISVNPDMELLYHDDED